MPLKWKKVWVSDERYESATVFDVNNDGILDIVSGAFWYEGPDFKKKHFIGNVRAEGEYYDDFSTIPIDVNGDGFIDFITGGWWGGKLVWKENPKGDPNKTWTEHIIDYTGNIESTRAWDIDGDGKLEIFPNTPCTRDVKYYKLQQKKNQEKHFEKITVFEFQEGKIQGHGLGVGDISGNGKLDIVLSKGWLERANFSSNENWIWHEEFDFGFNN
ncbi:MAG TPA: VCBS repeat-containing protein, partial [Victivallales bacterium]|nr:VCBS repeat-containing protein [Victivallales bacterium]